MTNCCAALTQDCYRRLPIDRVIALCKQWGSVRLEELQSVAIDGLYADAKRPGRHELRVDVLRPGAIQAETVTSCTLRPALITLLPTFLANQTTRARVQQMRHDYQHLEHCLVSSRKSTFATSSHYKGVASRTTRCGSWSDVWSLPSARVAVHVCWLHGAAAGRNQPLR